MANQDNGKPQNEVTLTEGGGGGAEDKANRGRLPASANRGNRRSNLRLLPTGVLANTQRVTAGQHVNPGRPRVSVRYVVVVVKGLRTGIMALDFRTESGRFPCKNN